MILATLDYKPKCLDGVFVPDAVQLSENAFLENSIAAHTTRLKVYPTVRSVTLKGTAFVERDTYTQALVDADGESYFDTLHLTWAEFLANAIVVERSASYLHVHVLRADVEATIIYQLNFS